MKLNNLFVKRQNILKEKLSVWGIDSFLCDNPIDIFYLSGMKLSLGKLMIQAKETVLFVDGRYYEAAKKKACCLVKKMDEQEILSLLTSPKWSSVRTIGFDTSTSYIRFKTFKKYLKDLQKKRKIKSSYQMKELTHPIRTLREIKDRSELLLIKKSAELLWKGFTHVKNHLHLGIEEREVALEFEFYCRKHGAEELAFPPIIAFGQNSAFPHYSTGKTRLKEGDIVLMDLGLKLNGYASDMTRTFLFGESSKFFKKIHTIVEEAKEAALELCKPNIDLKEIDEAARKVIRKANFEKYFLHSLGHGIGLDVHESPNFRTDKVRLKPGMVLTIEPGLYFPGKGGIRLEDMVIITKTGHQNLFNI